MATPAALGPSIGRAQGQGAGVALVIGNSKYRWESSLPNVKRDAPDVARAFQALGLRTELLQDVGRDAMRAAVDKFAAAARGANFAAFYYAGHGAAWEKDTYLVGEDTDLANPATVQSLLPVSAISAAMKDAAHRLLVFDNCRNNPADGWRQRAAVELSRVAATELAATSLNGPNTLVLFSTAPGRVAVDGPPGENSPFAATFLRKLASPAIDLQALAADLRRDLLIATEGRQVLWDQSTYDQPFVLGGPKNRGAPGAGPGSSVDPSRIVELPKIYAFARERKLLLPAGLVAVRTRGDSPGNPRIGSYETTTRMSLGHNPDNLYWSIEPLLVIVVSVSDDGTAEIIASGRDWRASTLAGAAGNFWRYTTGTLSSTSLQFRFGRASDSPRTLKWKDANSGTHSVSAAGHLEYSTPFKRLDG